MACPSPWNRSSTTRRRRRRGAGGPPPSAPEPLEEVRPPLPGGAQRLAPPPPLDPPVIPREEDLRHLHAPGTPGAGCSGGARAARPRPRSSPLPAEASLPSTPGTSRAAASTTHERRQLPAGQHEVPERHLQVHRAARTRSSTPSYRPQTRISRPVLRQPPRQRLVETAARAGSSAPPAPPGACARAASMAAASGSGFITMPGAAAVGRVVGHPVLALGVLADVRPPAPPGARSPAPSRGCSPRGTPSHIRGNSVRISTSSFATSLRPRSAASLLVPPPVPGPAILPAGPPRSAPPRGPPPRTAPAARAPRPRRLSPPARPRPPVSYSPVTVPSASPSTVTTGSPSRSAQ